MSEQTKKIRMWLLISLGVFLLILFSGVGVLVCSQLSLSIRLNGDRNMTLAYGKTFQDPGCTVFLNGGMLFEEPVEMDLPVEVTGEVPEEQVGSFLLGYQCKKLWLTGRAERQVTVEDKVPPVIQLVSLREPEPGVPYEEEGFTARDNADGDLTAKVQRKEYEGKIRYSVSDSSGNYTEVYRTVTTFDITPPVILLEGEREVSLPYGIPWQEPGFHAEDQADGDLSEKVTVEGQVDPWVPGTYVLTYTVADQWENTAILTRKVTVGPAPRPEVIYPQKKTIYLTFDDGPGPYTDLLLDVLSRYGVKATFFVVGTGHSREMQRIVREGHSIAVHSVTHDYRQIYASRDAYFEDLLGMQQIIENHTGVKTSLLRFPGGSSNMVSSFTPGIMTELTEAVQDAGFQYFDWNVDSNDAGGAKTPEEVYQNVTEGCRNHRVSIVLQHDIHPFSVAAVEAIIQWGQSHGYQFLPLNEHSYGAHHGVNN